MSKKFKSWRIRDACHTLGSTWRELPKLFGSIYKKKIEMLQVSAGSDWTSGCPVYILALFIRKFLIRTFFGPGRWLTE